MVQFRPRGVWCGAVRSGVQSRGRRWRRAFRSTERSTTLSKCIRANRSSANAGQVRASAAAPRRNGTTVAAHAAVGLLVAVVAADRAAAHPDALSCNGTAAGEEATRGSSAVSSYKASVSLATSANFSTAGEYWQSLRPQNRIIHHEARDRHLYSSGEWRKGGLSRPHKKSPRRRTSW